MQRARRRRRPSRPRRLLSSRAAGKLPHCDKISGRRYMGMADVDAPHEISFFTAPNFAYVFRDRRRDAETTSASFTRSRHRPITPRHKYALSAASIFIRRRRSRKYSFDIARAAADAALHCRAAFDFKPLTPQTAMLLMINAPDAA